MHKDDEGAYGCLAVVAAAGGLWVVYTTAPISIYCVLAGGATFLLRWCVRQHPPAEADDGFARRLGVGLLTDSAKVAFWLFVGFAVVWVLQIVISLFQAQIGPDDVDAAEQWLMDFSRQAKTAFSARVALALLSLALLLSLAVSALWPLIALGRLRRGLTALGVVIAAMTSFTFVTVDYGAAQHQAVAESIRAQISTNLARLAGSRREHAALQWIAAEMTRTAEDGADPRREWQSYFRAVSAACASDQAEYEIAYAEEILNATGTASSPFRRSLEQVFFIERTAELRPTAGDARYCNEQQYALSFFSQRLAVANAPRAGRARDVAAAEMRDLARRWVPDFQRHLAEASEAVPRNLEDEARPFHVTRRIEERRQLVALERTTRQAADYADRARASARQIVYDAVAELLPSGARGAAEVIVQAWTGAFVQALGHEGIVRIEQRVAALSERLKGLFTRNEALRPLVSAEPPLVLPAREGGSAANIASAVANDARAAAHLAKRDPPIVAGAAAARRAIEHGAVPGVPPIHTPRPHPPNPAPRPRIPGRR